MLCQQKSQILRAPSYLEAEPNRLKIYLGVERWMWVFYRRRNSGEVEMIANEAQKPGSFDSLLGIACVRKGCRPLKYKAQQILRRLIVQMKLNSFSVISRCCRSLATIERLCIDGSLYLFPKVLRPLVSGTTLDHEQDLQAR
nr:hypothetical protein Iba_chr07aCG8840 [Ipomoea batatas]